MGYRRIRSSPRPYGVRRGHRPDHSVPRQRPRGNDHRRRGGQDATGMRIIAIRRGAGESERTGREGGDWVVSPGPETQIQTAMYSSRRRLEPAATGLRTDKERIALSLSDESYGRDGRQQRRQQRAAMTRGRTRATANQSVAGLPAGRTGEQPRREQASEHEADGRVR